MYCIVLIFTNKKRREIAIDEYTTKLRRPKYKSLS